MNPSPLTLTSLPREDILHRHLFPYLHLRDLFCLAGTGRDLHNAVHDFFQVMLTLDLIYVGPKFSSATLAQIVKDSFLLRTVKLGPSHRWVNNDDLMPIIKNNTNLETVDLSGCTGLNNGVLHCLGRHLPSLSSLSLSGCQWVSNQGLLMLAESCRGLTMVDLAGCWDLENSTLCSLVKYCPRLVHINMSGIYSVTDSFVMTTAKHCPGLRVLNIHGCWRVTDDGISCLAEYCKCLRMLRVRDCRSVTEASLARLRPRGVLVDRPRPSYTVDRQHAQFLQKLKLQV